MRTTGASASRPSAWRRRGRGRQASRAEPRTWAPGLEARRSRRSVKPGDPREVVVDLAAATNVPRPTPRSTRPAAASDGSAWRTVMRLTPSPAASSRSAGMRAPAGQLARRRCGRRAAPRSGRSAAHDPSAAVAASAARRFARSPAHWSRPFPSLGPGPSRVKLGLRPKARALYLRAGDARRARQQVSRGDVDTVLLALTDMQGRLQGKRLTAAPLPRRRRRARRRGLQLPARGRRRHGHRRGLRDVLVGARATATS